MIVILKRYPRPSRNKLPKCLIFLSKWGKTRQPNSNKVGYYETDLKWNKTMEISLKSLDLCNKSKANILIIFIYKFPHNIAKRTKDNFSHLFLSNITKLTLSNPGVIRFLNDSKDCILYFWDFLTLSLKYFTSLRKILAW